MVVTIYRTIIKAFAIYNKDNFIFKVNETADQIVEAFIERLMDKDWLDEKTKDRCVEKVSRISFIIVIMSVYMFRLIPSLD